MYIPKRDAISRVSPFITVVNASVYGGGYGMSSISSCVVIITKHKKVFVLC